MRPSVRPPPKTATLTTASINNEDPATRYDIVGIIGRGSYGKVYAATDRFSGAKVAIKSIPADETDDEAAHAELAREADVLRRCAYPFIVSFYGAFFHERTLYVATQLCEAGSLLDVLRAQLRLHGTASLTEPALLAVATAATAALRYLHDEARVLHRDLKGANLLLTARGEVKLCDFGVSAQLTSTMPRRSTVIGTPHWMSPELIGGCDYDAAADVWSLGITVLECARGHPPHFDAKPALRVLLLITTSPPPTLADDAAASAEQYSDSLHAWLRGCLQKEPGLRLTAAQLLARCRAMAGTEPSPCHPHPHPVTLTLSPSTLVLHTAAALCCERMSTSRRSAAGSSSLLPCRRSLIIERR